MIIRDSEPKAPPRARGSAKMKEQQRQQRPQQLSAACSVADTGGQGLGRLGRSGPLAPQVPVKLAGCATSMWRSDRGRGGS